MLKISVIIPVYNTEKYLTQCLESVINQTYKNLEIICVEDCSTDNSKEILQKYAQKDDRIKIVYNEINSKLGISRNNGFSVATGDYIHFLDSDDWLELNAYEKMLAATIDNPDIIYFYYQEVSEIDNNITEYLSSNPNNTNKLIKIDDDYRKNIEFTEQVWNKLYSKEFLDKYDLLHNAYPCFEDMEFTLKIRIFAGTIYYLNDILLNYRTNRKNSLIANGSKHLGYIVKSYLNAEKWCTNLIDWNIGQYLLAGQFYLLSSKLFSEYENKNISYKELVSLLKCINFDLLKDIVWHVELRKCKEAISHPEYYYRFKNLLRKILRENCPILHKFLVKIRKRFIN